MTDFEFLKKNVIQLLYGTLFFLIIFCFISCENESLYENVYTEQKDVEQKIFKGKVSVIRHENFGEMLSFASRDDVFDVLYSWNTPPSVEEWEQKLSFKSMRISTSTLKEKYCSPVQLFLNDKGYIMIADTLFHDIGSEVLYYDRNDKTFKHYLFNGATKTLPIMTKAITKDKVVHNYLDTYNPNRPQDGYYRIDGWLEFDSGNWLTNAVITAKTTIYVNGKRYNAHNIGVYYSFDVDINGKNKVEPGRHLESSRTHYFEQYLVKAKSIKIGYVYTTHYANGGKDDISASIKLRME